MLTLAKFNVGYKTLASYWQVLMLLVFFIKGFVIWIDN